jgi:hypothetical protein
LTAIDLVAHVSPLFTVLRPARAFTKTIKQTINKTRQSSVVYASHPVVAIAHHDESVSDRSIHIHTFGSRHPSIHPSIHSCFPIDRSIDRSTTEGIYIKTYLRLSRWVSQPPPSSRSCPVQSRRKVKTSVNHSDAPNASSRPSFVVIHSFRV